MDLNPLVILVIVVGISAVYMMYIKARAGGGSDYYRKHFGISLDSGEKPLHMWNAYFDVDVSTAEKVAVGAAGLMLGQLVKIRGKHIMVLVTDKGRLALGMKEGGGEPMVFEGAPRPRIEPVGDGKGKLAGDKGLESTKIVRITLPEGESFRLSLAASAADALCAWGRV